MDDVTESKEFKRLTEGMSRSTVYGYTSSLQKFSDFHGMALRELINESKNWEPEDSETSHLEEKPAEERLREWHRHLLDEDVSKKSARMYWSRVKNFFETFGISINIESPEAPSYTNERPDFSASDVRKMSDAARCPRDRAIILCAFQGGMGPTEISELDYNQVKYEIENDECPIPVWKIRKKTQIQHHTWLLKDAVEALKLYLAERKKEEGELEDDDPLFVRRNNGKRIKPNNIQAVMRDIRDRVGEAIPEAQKISSKVNPLSLKFLRRAFGIACDKAKVDTHFKEYWMGHVEPYNGAYSSGQIPKEVQREELKKLKPFLSVTTTREEFEQKEREQDKRIQELSEVTSEQDEKIKELSQEKEELKNKLNTFRDVIVGDLVRDVDTFVTVRLEEISAVELNEMLSKRIDWYESEDEWVCNYSNSETDWKEPDLNELAELKLTRLKELRDEVREIAKTHGD